MMANKIKITTIGDSSTGKSCLLRQFVHQGFEPTQNLTIGVDLYYKIVTLHAQPIKLQIWDTSGHETFRHITRIYYRGSHVILFVYDATNRVSFEHLTTWLQYVKEECIDEYQPTMMLVGNKIDLNSERVVTFEEGQEFANTHHMLFIEVSAKTGTHVEDAFLQAVGHFMNRNKEWLLSQKMVVDIEDIEVNTTCCWE